MATLAGILILPSQAVLSLPLLSTFLIFKKKFPLLFFRSPFCPLQIMERVWALTPTLSEMKEENYCANMRIFCILLNYPAWNYTLHPTFCLIIHLLVKRFWKVICPRRLGLHLLTIFSMKRLVYKISENSEMLDLIRFLPLFHFWIRKVSWSSMHWWWPILPKCSWARARDLYCVY